MKRVGSVCLLVSVVVAHPSCVRPPPGGLARVIQTTPSQGEVGEPDLQSGIRVTFARAVGPPDRLGRTIIGPALALDPPVSGEARWLDARTLAFFPSARLQPSRRYRVQLARGLAT